MSEPSNDTRDAVPSIKDALDEIYDDVAGMEEVVVSPLSVGAAGRQLQELAINCYVQYEMNLFELSLAMSSAMIVCHKIVESVEAARGGADA